MNEKTLNQFPQAIQQKAIKGLLVDKNFTDEPSSVLL
jgi:hypothetical protein